MFAKRFRALGARVAQQDGAYDRANPALATAGTDPRFSSQSNMKLCRSVFGGLLMSFVVSSGADFIVDPFEDGLRAVTITGVGRNPDTGIYNITGPVFDASGRQLEIGGSFALNPSSLTLTSDIGLYDVTGIAGLSLVSVGETQPGTLTIDGGQVAGGAFISSDRRRLWGDGGAVVNVVDGGQILSAGNTQFGFMTIGATTGDTTTGGAALNVSGAGSLVEVLGGLSIGSSSNFAIAPNLHENHVTVTDGGHISVFSDESISYGIVFVGDSLSNSSSDTLTVSGSGSEVRFDWYLGVDGVREGEASLSVLDGATLRQVESVRGDRSEVTVLAVRESRGSANLVVGGTNSQVVVLGDIEIGSSAPVFVGRTDPSDFSTNIFELAAGGTIKVFEGGLLETSGLITAESSGNAISRLIVSSDGIVRAAEIVLGSNSILSGDGGVLESDVILDGGILSPGESPGVMTIDGDLSAMSGEIIFEFYGAGIGQYDVLNITGDFFTGSDLKFGFSFLDGFTPDAGDVFDFMNIGGIYDPQNISMLLENAIWEGLDSEFGLSAFYEGGSFVLASFDPFDDERDTTAVDEPPVLLLMLFGLAGLYGLRRRRAS